MWTRKTRCEFVSHLDRFDTECRTSHKRTCELVCRIRLDFLTSLAKFWSYKMISLQQRKILRILQKERGRTNSHCWAIVDMQRKELEDSKTIAAGYQRRWRNKVWEKKKCLQSRSKIHYYYWHLPHVKSRLNNNDEKKLKKKGQFFLHYLLVLHYNNNDNKRNKHIFN